MAVLSSNDWEQYLERYPDAHLLQTTPWATLKNAFGWNADWVISTANNFEIGAQILFRQVVPGISMAYMPKGPIYDHCKHPYPPSWNKFWNQVDRMCHKKRAAFLKVEPDFWVKSETSFQLEDGFSDDIIPTCFQIIPESIFPPSGFRMGKHSIQPPRTLVINLVGDEDQLLSRMKQKTRYNIKLALKRGVVVRPSSDIAAFHQLMELTGERDRFDVHSHQYYQAAYDIFHSRGSCQMLCAEYEGRIIACLMVFAYGRRAWYLYGASSNEHRDFMPTYILQWEAMRWARAQGCQEYDLWGVPDADVEYLEANFSDKRDNLWGVYRFKRGFGGELRKAAGPWDRVYQPLTYLLYKWKTKGTSETIPGQP